MTCLGSDPDQAALLGLVRVPGQGEVFSSRSGAPKAYLFDTRGATSNLPLREFLVAELVRATGHFRPQVIGGVAKSGTVWGAWLAWQIGLPFANILLAGPRSSGLQREVEGMIEGLSVLLVDNWVHSGESLAQAVEVVRRNRGIVCGALSLVARPPGLLTHPFACLYAEDTLVESATRIGLLQQS